MLLDLKTIMIVYILVFDMIKVEGEVNKELLQEAKKRNNNQP